VRSIQTRIGVDGIVDAPVLVLASVTESVVTATWHLVRDGGLPAVFLLMALGSACIPIPSEVVMLFAGFAVADPGGSGAHHHLTMTGIVLAGLLGTLVGSWIAYGIGRGGRLELMERHGHLVHMGPAQIDRADRWFRRYGDPAVLFGRMIPLVRAFVSLPAGVAKMPPLRFTVLTIIGSIPWVLALALAGQALGSEWTSVRKGFEYVDYAIVALVVVGVGYWIVRRRRAGQVVAVEAAAGDSDRASSSESAPVDVG
jgi:membrane protein DedA with SNARE-associated domain